MLSRKGSKDQESVAFREEYSSRNRVAQQRKGGSTTTKERKKQNTCATTNANGRNKQSCHEESCGIIALSERYGEALLCGLCGVRFKSWKPLVFELRLIETRPSLHAQNHSNHNTPITCPAKPKGLESSSLVLPFCNGRVHLALHAAARILLRFRVPPSVQFRSARNMLDSPLRHGRK